MPGAATAVQHPEKALRCRLILNKIRYLQSFRKGSSDRSSFPRALVSFWKKIDFQTLLMYLFFTFFTK